MNCIKSQDVLMNPIAAIQCDTKACEIPRDLGVLATHMYVLYCSIVHKLPSAWPHQGTFMHMGGVSVPRLHPIPNSVIKVMRQGLVHVQLGITA